MVNYGFIRFDTLVLFFEDLDSGAKIKNSRRINSSYFISLSNGNNPTEIGRNCGTTYTYGDTCFFLWSKFSFIFHKMIIG